MEVILLLIRGIVLGGIVLRDSCLQGSCPRGSCHRGNCPVTLQVLIRLLSVPKLDTSVIGMNDESLSSCTFYLEINNVQLDDIECTCTSFEGPCFYNMLSKLASKSY